MVIFQICGFAYLTGNYFQFKPKSAWPRPATLLKKETLAQMFSCEFCEISKNTLFQEHLWTTACEYLIKPLNFLTVTQSLLQSHEMLQAKCTC